MATITNLSGVLNNEITDNGSNLTSSTGITLLHSVLVVANTFKEGDYISFGGMFSTNLVKIASATARLYINTGNTLTGALQVATRSLAISQDTIYISRKMFITNKTGVGTGNSIGTQTISSTLNFVNDYLSSTTSQIAIDWTVDQYFISAGSVVNTSDSLLSYGIKVFKY